jgi:O-antigen ligase
MRGLARGLLLLFVFAIPWEYSLDLGAPVGNIARLAGMVLLLVAVPAILQSGRMRRPGLLQWLVLVLYLWFCFSYFWTIEPRETLVKLRGYFQEFMVVWFVWEFADSFKELRAILRAWLSGAGVLALLSLANFASAVNLVAGQYRFAAAGQDPNDAARFLVFGFPIAAFLMDAEGGRLGRWLAASYFPVGLAALLLTGSRSGFVCTLVAFAGCALLLVRRNPRAAAGGGLALTVVALWLWFIAPHDTLTRLTTIAEQLERGDLNQRLNIWAAGWHAFVEAPLIGHGAGSFVTAAGLAPIDTAHNTALSIIVEGGLCAAFIAIAILIASVRSAIGVRGSLRIALVTLLAVLLVSASVGTLFESRSTWLLLSLIALAERLARDDPEFVNAGSPGMRAELDLAGAGR